MFAQYQVLVVVGTEPDRGADLDLMAAYRVGLCRDLERVAADNAEVTVQFLKGGHGLLFQHPDDLAARIAAFLNW